MNWTEIFHEYLSELYWIGYAKYLLKHDPEKYEFEFEEFSRIYDV